FGRTNPTFPGTKFRTATCSELWFIRPNSPTCLENRRNFRPDCLANNRRAIRPNYSVASVEHWTVWTITYCDYNWILVRPDSAVASDGGTFCRIRFIATINHWRALRTITLNFDYFWRTFRSCNHHRAIKHRCSNGGFVRKPAITSLNTTTSFFINLNSRCSIKYTLGRRIRPSKSRLV
ncbi:MAG: hypothetical protein ACK56F_16420, partial [bacterium]